MRKIIYLLPFLLFIYLLKAEMELQNAAITTKTKVEKIISQTIDLPCLKLKNGLADTLINFSLNNGEWNGAFYLKAQVADSGTKVLATYLEREFRFKNGATSTSTENMDDGVIGWLGVRSDSTRILMKGQISESGGKATITLNSLDTMSAISQIKLSDGENLCFITNRGETINFDTTKVRITDIVRDGSEIASCKVRLYQDYSVLGGLDISANGEIVFPPNLSLKLTQGSEGEPGNGFGVKLYNDTLKIKVKEGNTVKTVSMRPGIRITQFGVYADEIKTTRIDAFKKPSDVQFIYNTKETLIEIGPSDALPKSYATNDTGANKIYDIKGSHTSKPLNIVVGKILTEETMMFGNVWHNHALNGMVVLRPGSDLFADGDSLLGVPFANPGKGNEIYNKKMFMASMKNRKYMNDGNGPYIVIDSPEINYHGWHVKVESSDSVSFVNFNKLTNRGINTSWDGQMYQKQTPVGVEEQPKVQQDFKIYPNPVIDNLNLERERIGQATLIITNQLSQTVYKSFVGAVENKINLPFSEASAGVYFICFIYSDGYIVKQKFIKQ
jgi:hypothetical protein